MITIKSKLTQMIPVAVVLLAIGFTYLSQWCVSANLSCYDTLIRGIFDGGTSPLYLFTLYFLPITIILVFVPRHTFNSWAKFAAVALPLTFIFIASQPVYPQGMFSTDRDDAARLASEILSVASLALVIWNYFRARKTRLS